MKRLLLLTAVLLVASCSNRETSTTTETDFRVARDQYRTELRGRVDQLNMRIDSLRARRDSLQDAAAQAEMSERIAAIEARRDTIRARIDDFGEDTEAAWNATRAQLEEWMRDLESGVNEAWDRLTR